MNNQQDRRIHQRRKANWPVIIQLKDKTGFKTHTIDISESGASIASTIKIPEGNRIKMQITAIIGGKKIKVLCVAECRFVSLSNNIYQCGMRLIGLQDEQKKLIRQFVEQKSDLTKNRFDQILPSEVKHASSQYP